MAFGKKPLTSEEIATFRTQAAVILARSPLERVSAFEPHIAAELALLRHVFGDDERLGHLAITLAMYDMLDSVENWRTSGDAVVDALSASERLDAGEAQSDPAFAAWAEAAKAPPPPSRVTKGALTPFDHAVRSASGLYWAFALTNGRAPGAKSDPFADPLATAILGTIAVTLKNAIKKGATFERAPDVIVLDWLARPRRLSKAFRPGGNPGSPLAFLAKEFLFDLDDEKLRVGQFTVRRGWVRHMRRRGSLGKKELLTGDVVQRLLDESEARMKHAPRAGLMNSTMIRERLLERQESGALAQKVAAKLGPAGRIPAEFAEELLEDELLPSIQDWLAQPSTTRALLPAGAVAAKVALGSRSVHALVIRYEKSRGRPFERDGRTRLVPVGELELIVDFANGTAT